MIKEAIAKIVEGSDLTQAQMKKAFNEIMNGKADPSQISAFITALRIKGESIDEITAAAKVMRQCAATINVRSGKEPVLDTCGTGGSGANAFNISTIAAFVIAGCGVKIAKHGNRSASSCCGSADLLEELGVNISLSPKQVERCIKRIGIGFMFAPLFHSAMKYAVGVRKAIAIRTIFNILGPLSNPANATCQVLGVYDRGLTEVMARVLSNLGVKRAFVVHGLDGLDEISITGPTQISELKNKKVKTYRVSPQKFGLKKANLSDIRGGDAKINAKIAVSILNSNDGPRRDSIILNAAYGLVAAGKAGNIKSGMEFAANSIDSRAALKKLNQLKDFSNR